MTEPDKPNPHANPYRFDPKDMEMLDELARRVAREPNPAEAGRLARVLASRTGYFCHQFRTPAPGGRIVTEPDKPNPHLDPRPWLTQPEHYETPEAFAEELERLRLELEWDLENLYPEGLERLGLTKAERKARDEAELAALDRSAEAELAGRTERRRLVASRHALREELAELAERLGPVDAARIGLLASKLEANSERATRLRLATYARRTAELDRREAQRTKRARWSRAKRG